MTEIEQLQLQHRCEQLELIVSHLSLIHAYTISKFSQYQRANNLFKDMADEETKKDDSFENKVSLLVTLITLTNEKLRDPIHFACHAIDDYLYTLNEPYKTIACQLFESITNEKNHKDLIIKISGYKPKECCSINKEGDDHESSSTTTPSTVQ